MGLTGTIFHEGRIFSRDLPVLMGLFIGERGRETFLHSNLQNKAGKVPQPAEEIDQKCDSVVQVSLYQRLFIPISSGFLMY